MISPSECDDVIRRATVNRKQEQQTTAPRNRCSVFEQILGRKEDFPLISDTGLRHQALPGAHYRAVLKGFSTVVGCRVQSWSVSCSSVSNVSAADGRRTETAVAQGFALNAQSPEA